MWRRVNVQIPFAYRFAMSGLFMISAMFGGFPEFMLFAYKVDFSIRGGQDIVNE